MNAYRWGGTAWANLRPRNDVKGGKIRFPAGLDPSLMRKRKVGNCALQTITRAKTLTAQVPPPNGGGTIRAPDEEKKEVTKPGCHRLGIGS